MENRFSEHFLNRLQQPVCAFAREAFRRWAYSGPKQGFIRIDVANPSKYSLIQEQRLDVCFAASEPGVEIIGRYVQRLSSQCRGAVRGWGPLNTAKCADVVEEQGGVL
ncbi:MAG TPA: hypothetical protein VEQ63_14850, partial [Bryobacteraceae bacterium]|nr:hypothetical protein [Bryobacteraceae bacterium]